MLPPGRCRRLPCPQLNVVVMRGQNEDELPAFVELTRHRPVNVRFIEYMPFDGNVWSDRKMVPYREMQDAIAAAFPQVGTPCSQQLCGSMLQRIWPGQCQDQAVSHRAG